MKPDKTPSEIIDYIAEVLRERQSKNLPTYYSISIEQFGSLTPVTERESGSDNFKQLVFKYFSDYNLTAILVQLYSNKSRNTKQPLQVFHIPLKKQNPLVLSGVSEKSTPEIIPAESSIPIHRHYDEKFDLQMRVVRAEMEKQSLLDKIAQLTERYEDRLKDNENRAKEKINDLQNEVRDLESEIKEFEREIHRYEREKHNSFGNIALGNIGARIAENFARTDMGTGILKGVLGKDGFTQLQSQLQGTAPQSPEAPKEQGARIIETGTGDNPRESQLNYIKKAAEALDENNLKMLYDILEFNSRDPRLLLAYWNQLDSLKKNTPPKQE